MQPFYPDNRLFYQQLISTGDFKVTSKSAMGQLMADINSNIMYGSVDLLILKTLTFGGPRHGLAIGEEIRRLSGERLNVEGNALYPSLHRLDNKGLVRGEWRISDKRRRAKFYSITPAGRRRLQRAIQEWISHTEAVRAVLEFAV